MSRLEQSRLDSFNPWKEAEEEEGEDSVCLKKIKSVTLKKKFQMKLKRKTCFFVHWLKTLCPPTCYNTKGKENYVTYSNYCKNLEKQCRVSTATISRA